MSSFVGLPLTFTGPIYTLLRRFIEIISEPQILSIFHQSLTPPLLKRYVFLLPQLVAHFKVCKPFLPIIIHEVLNVSSPQILFLDETPSSQVLIHWVSQNINSDFYPSFKKLLHSFHAHMGLKARSRSTQLSKILQFLNEHPQPSQFWKFFSRLCQIIHIDYPGYEQAILSRFFFFAIFMPTDHFNWRSLSFL